MSNFPLSDSEMIIDFIRASGIFNGKDTPFFGYLQSWNENKASGRQTYLLEGCNKVELHYTPSNGMLELKGSIMYFVQGHNFNYDKSAFYLGINHIGTLLGVNLWSMMIDELECGVIMEVDQRPRNYITHHREGKRMELHETPKDKGNFRSFNDKLARRKMYDAGRNIKHKQGLKRQQIIKEAGWNPDGNYLKWEIHYIKPEMTLNHGHGIRLSDLMNPNWQHIFRQDVYQQYKYIIPMKSIIMPNNKADFCAMDIMAIELIEFRLNEGKTIEEARKLLYKRINDSPLLSKPDKDARKRTIKALFDKLEESETSPWDLSRRLEEALGLPSIAPEMGVDSADGEKVNPL